MTTDVKTAAGVRIQKNAREFIPVRHRGKELIDARVHVPNDETGEPVPTRKELTVTHEVAAEVARAVLQVLGEEAEAGEVLP